MRRARLPGVAGLLLAAMSMPALAADPATETVHAVRPGETLNGIANRAGVSPGAIVTANGLKEPYALKVGQELKIPREKKPAGKAKAAPTAKTPSAPTAKAASRPAAKPAIPAASPETESVHVVQPGETLGGIAVRAKVPRVLIIEANGLQPPYNVRSGQKLQIPRTRHHVVAAGDTGFSVSMKYGVPWDQIATANSLDAAKPLKPGQDLLIPTLLNPPPAATAKPDPTPAVAAPAPVAATPPPPRAPRFAWPVSGPVRRDYSTGTDYHDGIDITAPKGTMVRAAAAGTVKFAGKEKEQFGNLVVLDHGDGWFTAYGFLSRVTVKEGARVAAGERVGLVGDTGLAKGSELHFEVRRDGKPVDPRDELPKAP